MKNLIGIVKEIKGCQFANLTYVTDGGIPQKVLGKGVVVTKLVRTDCQLNYSYENAVNNRLAKQGDVMLFKGSHGMHMELALEKFLKDDT